MRTVEIHTHGKIYDLVERKPDPNQYRYAVVKHYPRTVLEILGLKWVPDTRTLQDRPLGDDKGHAIQILTAWQDYIEDMNSLAGSVWAMSEGNMWINIRYIEEHKIPQAEAIICGGNYVRWKVGDETPTHVKLDCFPYDVPPQTYIHPLTSNWYTEPYHFFRACAIDGFGRIIKVGSALDVYLPILRRTETWIRKEILEIFPEGYDYQFRGMEVYNGNSALMTVSSNGAQTFYNGWKMSTKIIPVPFNWK